MVDSTLPETLQFNSRVVSAKQGETVGKRDGCGSLERKLAYARGMTSLRHYAAEYVYQMSVAAYLTLPMLVRDFSRNALSLVCLRRRLRDVDGQELEVLERERAEFFEALAAFNQQYDVHLARFLSRCVRSPTPHNLSLSARISWAARLRSLSLSPPTQAISTSQGTNHGRA